MQPQLSHAPVPCKPNIGLHCDLNHPVVLLSIEGFTLGNQMQTLAYFVQAENAAYAKGRFPVSRASQVNYADASAGPATSSKAHGTAYWDLV